MGSLPSALAANPFESCLRAIAIEVPGLHVVRQVLIRAGADWLRPDLVDRERKVVLEAASFAWHGSRPALRRDARRYNALVAHGWIVLRFAWEDVMSDQTYVREVLTAGATPPGEQARCGAPSLRQRGLRPRCYARSRPG